MNIIPRQTNPARYNVGMASLKLMLRTPSGLLMKSSPALIRGTFDQLGRGVLPGVKRTEDQLAGMKAATFTPKSLRHDEIILYCHGGCFVFGSTRSHSRVCSQIAKETQREVVVFDYRLAPEHKSPAAFEDALAAYQALQQQHRDKKIILMGDSAGGAMVLWLAKHLRDDPQMSDVQPAAVVAICPWCDFLLEHARKSDDKDPLLSLSALELYTPQMFSEGERVSMSSLNDNFKNLPPILMQSGTVDIFCQENALLAERLTADNPQGRCEQWQGMPHDWHMFYPLFKESAAAIKSIAAFLDNR